MYRATCAHMHPSTNETIWVNADTCGNASITSDVAKKMSTFLSRHQLLFREGVLQPIEANRKLDIPAGSAEEKNHDAVAHANGTRMLGRG